MASYTQAIPLQIFIDAHEAGLINEVCMAYFSFPGSKPSGPSRFGDIYADFRAAKGSRSDERQSPPPHAYKGVKKRNTGDSREPDLFS